MLNEFTFDLPDESEYEDLESTEEFANMDLSTSSNYEDIELTSESSFQDVPLEAESSYEDLDLSNVGDEYTDLDNSDSYSDDLSDVRLRPAFQLTTLGEDYSVDNLASH
jgi:hypothetical protein